MRTQEEFFDQFLAVLRIPLVKSAASGFFDNVRQIQSLVQMPDLLFGFLEIEHGIFTSFMSSAQERWSQGIDYVTFLVEHLKKTAPYSKVGGIPELPERIRKRRDEVLSHPSYGPMLASSMQVLYSAAVSGSWTAFECLAGDLWAAALNEYPLPLAQAAFSCLDTPEAGELTGKQISVGLAAKYGFDLRRSLGTLLKPKFDFTSVRGTQKAYKVFISSDDVLQNIFEDPVLSELEATRHLIVHSASKVDEEYKKRSGSTLEAGMRLTFTEEKTVEFARASQMAGFHLLAFVNDWLGATLRTGDVPRAGGPPIPTVNLNHK
jgi:hypothetical protein